MTYHPESAAITPRSNTTPQPRLFDEVRRRLRLKHYSLSTERIYLQWMRRFILASGRRHPRDMGAREGEAFLTLLATRDRVSASTQNPGCCALSCSCMFVDVARPWWLPSSIDWRTNEFYAKPSRWAA
jgi:hypothetical protein